MYTSPHMIGRTVFQLMGPRINTVIFKERGFASILVPLPRFCRHRCCVLLTCAAPFKLRARNFAVAFGHLGADIGPRLFLESSGELRTTCSSKDVAPSRVPDVVPSSQRHLCPECQVPLLGILKGFSQKETAPLPEG